MHNYRTSRVAGLVFGVLLMLPYAAAAQETFPTPDAATKALIEAAQNPGQGMLDRIFGTGGAALLSSGNADVDAKRIKDFLAAAAKGTSVTDGTDGSKVLVFGADGWRFPIPLKAKDGAWTFDLAAGKQEIVDRAIGRNELTAIGACADYVAAQKEYFASLHDDEPVQQYARRFISTPGLHDGLYWAPEAASDRSPLGDRIAAAALENAGPSDKPRAYNGYIYRILTRQGPDAPGGAYNYIVKGRLLAGFAMLAYPANWKETGVMTFLCDQRGQVHQANLGPETATIAANITSFNPGEGWEPVGD